VENSGIATPMLANTLYLNPRIFFHEFFCLKLKFDNPQTFISSKIVALWHLLGGLILAELSTSDLNLAEG